MRKYMATHVLANFLIPLLFLQRVSSGFDWTYTYQTDWPKTCTNGVLQSPIDIETKRVSVNHSLYLKRENYDKDFENFRITNNGRTAQLSLDMSDDDEDRPSITGTAVHNEIYVLAQLHFHWSLEDKGSEHTINGRSHSMEMHLAHFNKKYGNFIEAINHEDGLAVVSALFDITDKDNPYFDAIVEGVKYVNIEGEDDYINKVVYRENQSIPSLRLEDLLPNDIDLFFRYEGSLTTPPCAEVVTWILYHDTNYIGLNQIKAFRGLKDSTKHLIGDTFRDLQSTNDRKIEVSKELRGLASHVDSSVVATHLSIITSLLMLAKY